MNVKYEHPDGLAEHGRRAWDVCVTEFGPRMREVDTLLLEQFCRLMDLFPRLNERAASGAKGGMLELAILIDKMLAFSARLGLSYADRAKLKLEGPGETKPTAKKPKTKLDGLTPSSLGITQPDAYRAK